MQAEGEKGILLTSCVRESSCDTKKIYQAYWPSKSLPLDVVGFERLRSDRRALLCQISPYILVLLTRAPKSISIYS